MPITDCRREAPPHGYTMHGINGRYTAGRIYPHAMGFVLGGPHEGILVCRTWRRQRVVPAVPEEHPPWRHPILGELRLLAAIMNLLRNAERCTMTRGSCTLTRSALAYGC